MVVGWKIMVNNSLLAQEKIRKWLSSRYTRNTFLKKGQKRLVSLYVKKTARITLNEYKNLQKFSEE